MCACKFWLRSFIVTCKLLSPACHCYNVSHWSCSCLPVCRESLQSEFVTKREAAWAIANFAIAGLPQQLSYFIQNNGIPFLCELLMFRDNQVSACILLLFYLAHLSCFRGIDFWLFSFLMNCWYILWMLHACHILFSMSLGHGVRLLYPVGVTLILWCGTVYAESFSDHH